MATILDVTGIAQFADIFVFIVVLIFLWMLMQATKFLGDNKTLHGLIAFVVALLMLITPVVNDIVKSILPWVGVVMIFIVVIMMATKAAGGATIPGFGDFKFIIFLVLALVIVIGAFVQIRQNVSLPGDEEGFEDTDRDFSNTMHIIFHPRMLGFFLIAIIAIFTIVLMTGKMN